MSLNCGEPQQKEEEEPEIEKKKGIWAGGDVSYKSGCLVALIVVAFAILAVVIFQFLSSDGDTKKPDILKFSASVSFTGTQFIIINQDTFDWLNVKLEINAGLIAGGYSLEHPVMKAGQSYTVGALQFAKSDGTRFNPITMKPQKLAIYSRDKRGMIKGSYHARWK